MTITFFCIQKSIGLFLGVRTSLAGECIWQTNVFGRFNIFGGEYIWRGNIFGEGMSLGRRKSSKEGSIFRRGTPLAGGGFVSGRRRGRLRRAVEENI